MLDVSGMQLDILKGFYCEVKSMKVRDGTKHIMPLLDCWKLNLQQGMFKMAMGSNNMATMLSPFVVNPLTHF